MKIPLKALGLAAMVLLFGQQAFGKDLYVASGGNDAVTYANNAITTPWATPVKAWAEAQAGDTVYFRGGTYLLGVIYTDGNGEIQTVGVFTRLVGNHGTAEHPIRFVSYPGELATFDCRDVYTGILIAKAYHIIDRIRFVNHAVGIVAGYWGGDHLTVKNCEGVANRKAAAIQSTIDGIEAQYPGMIAYMRDISGWNDFASSKYFHIEFAIGRFT